MAEKLPELLSPAGSGEAFDAAIEGGADAIYFGGTAFNARMSAKNFDGETLGAYIKKAHAYGVKCYVTLNTLVGDRELDRALAAAREFYEKGADGLIVADLGLAVAIRRFLPDIELHASTQMSGHNSAAAKELEKFGFSRMVIAREATLGDIKSFTETSNLELEVFVHGALCVSHSGQCLFSSMVGGRSGNRGECAQPCRLPYASGYSLSLKDLCLAGHIKELIDAKVASLKIEGRMKPPDYVYNVTKTYRKLLDERRNATPDEIKYLSEVFSRGGFTDGYFCGKIGRQMLGVRSKEDKEASRGARKFTGLTKKVPVDIKAEFYEGIPSKLTIISEKKSITVCGDAPFAAINAPMIAADFEKSLVKLGGTPFEAKKVEIKVGNGVMLPISKINELRRRAVESLLDDERDAPEKTPESIKSFSKNTRKTENTAVFASPEQITGKARKYFDKIYLPLEKYSGETDGFVMPPVIFDREKSSVEKMLAAAKEKGAKYALVGNVGHIKLAEKYGFELNGDFRLNATNSESVAALEELGLDGVILSPELTLPQIADIKGRVSVIVYGRIPLMTVEKCVICELGGCQNENCAKNLIDRTGAAFPVMRTGDCRNIIYNSLPTCMSDKQSELSRAKITARHFIFSDETPGGVDKVIKLFEAGAPADFKVRRI